MLERWWQTRESVHLGGGGFVDLRGGVYATQDAKFGYEFSVFVENIPPNCPSQYISMIFGKFGLVSDVYIPKKLTRHTRRRFGFVRFRSEREASLAIKHLSGVSIGQFRLGVSIAKFSKQGFKTDAFYATANTKPEVYPFKSDNPRFPVSKPTARMLDEDGHVACPIRNVVGLVDSVMDEQLRRSIVGVSDGPRDPDSLAIQISSTLPSCLMVRDLGHYKFILTFGSKEEADLMLEEYRDFLLDWFTDVYSWNEYEICDTRRVWLVIRGLPPQAWSAENINKIASCRGRPVCLDHKTNTAGTFSFAHVLVNTGQFSRISEEVIFSLGSRGFRVFVQEELVSNPVVNCGSLDNPTKAPSWDSSGDGVSSHNDSQNLVVHEADMVGVAESPLDPISFIQDSLGGEFQQGAVDGDSQLNNDANIHANTEVQNSAGNRASAGNSLDIAIVGDSSDSDKTRSFDYTGINGLQPLVEIPVTGVDLDAKSPSRCPSVPNVPVGFSKLHGRLNISRLGMFKKSRKRASQANTPKSSHLVDEVGAARLSQGVDAELSHFETAAMQIWETSRLVGLIVDETEEEGITRIIKHLAAKEREQGGCH